MVILGDIDIVACYLANCNIPNNKNRMLIIRWRGGAHTNIDYISGITDQGDGGDGEHWDNGLIRKSRAMNILIVKLLPPTFNSRMDDNHPW